MQFLAFVAATGTLVVPALASMASVLNNCPGTVYVQSWPFDGSAPGPLTELPTSGKFTESLRPSGSSIKIATNKNLDGPLFASYSLSSNGAITYYEFSKKWGNPFLSSHNVFSAGAGCNAFDCSANDSSCYSLGDGQREFECPSPVDLAVTLCA